MRFLFLLLALTCSAFAEDLPQLHLYTEDGKALVGWNLPDFEEHWHPKAMIAKESQEWASGASLVVQYRTSSGWVYNRQVATPRAVRKAWRASNRVTAAGVTTLIWIHADGCGPCRRMEKDIEKLSKEVPTEIIEWDWESPTEWSIQAVPVTVLVDADSKELKRWVGYVDYATVKAELQNAK